MLNGISETITFSTLTTDKVENNRDHGAVEKIAKTISEIVLIIFLIILCEVIIYTTLIVGLLAGLYAHSPTACLIVSGALVAGMIFSFVMDRCMCD